MALKKQTKLNIPKARRHTQRELKNKSIEDEKVLKIGNNVNSNQQIHPERLIDETDKMLRKFDLNYTYGPCVGITRLERWERAKNLGLHPPESVRNSLLKDKTSVYQECLFNQFRYI